jgi:hypothetical protein
LVPRLSLSDAVFAARHRLVRVALWTSIVLVMLVWVVDRIRAGAQHQVRDIVQNQTDRVQAAHVSLARAAQHVAGAVEEARRIR